MTTNDYAAPLFKLNRYDLHTRARAYFFDADTGEELYAAEYRGNDESGIWKGRRYTDTRLGVDCVDLTTNIGGNVTAACFPGRRVIVKVWFPEMAGEVFALVDRARGWTGNETPGPVCDTAKLGIKLP